MRECVVMKYEEPPTSRRADIISSLSPQMAFGPGGTSPRTEARKATERQQTTEGAESRNDERSVVNQVRKPLGMNAQLHREPVRFKALEP